MRRKTLGEAYAFYEDFEEGVGGEFLERLDSAIRSLSFYPTKHQLWPGANPKFEVRRIRVTKSPYYIGYLVRDGEIIVLSVVHAKRRPGFWFGRFEDEP